MGWLVELILFSSISSMVGGSLTKCHSHGTEYVQCFEHAGMHPGDYVWVRMRVAKKCHPSGYAIVQLGHTTVGYAPKRPMTATVSEGKLKAPHWFYREDYRPRMQMRISERNSMLNVRKIDYGREKPDGNVRAYYGGRKTIVDAKFPLLVQEEYYDIKIQLVANGALHVYFNGVFITELIPGVQIPHSTHLIDALNVFEFYRSNEPGYSDFGTEDEVSLQGSAYLQPFIATLKSGGLPAGGAVRLDLNMEGPIEILFITTELQPQQYKLVIEDAKVSIDMPFDMTVKQLQEDGKWSWQEDVVHKFPAMWDGEVRKVIVQDCDPSKSEMHIRYADVTNDENPDVLSFRKPK